MICALVVGKICKYEFRLYLQNLSGICKMGITFAYELGWKRFLYEKSSTRKVTSKFYRGYPVKHFQNPQKPNRKKVTRLLRSRVEKIEKISNYVVKLWSNNGQTNYSRILVLLNNYFSYFEFWSNLVKLWSNNGQTMVKLIIQEILVLLNNYCFLKQ